MLKFIMYQLARPIQSMEWVLWSLTSLKTYLHKPSYMFLCIEFWYKWNVIHNFCNLQNVQFYLNICPCHLCLLIKNLVIVRQFETFRNSKCLCFARPWHLGNHIDKKNWSPSSWQFQQSKPSVVMYVDRFINV